jgi:hypothetical protein
VLIAQGTPAGNPQGLGDGNISGVPGAFMSGAGSLPTYSAGVGLTAAPNETFAETNAPAAGLSSGTLVSSKTGSNLTARGNFTGPPSSASGLGTARTGNFSSSFPLGNSTASTNGTSASSTSSDSGSTDPEASDASRATPDLGSGNPDAPEGTSPDDGDAGTDSSFASTVSNMVEEVPQRSRSRRPHV